MKKKTDFSEKLSSKSQSKHPEPFDFAQEKLSKDAAFTVIAASFDFANLNSDTSRRTSKIIMDKRILAFITATVLFVESSAHIYASPILAAPAIYPCVSNSGQGTVVGIVTDAVTLQPIAGADVQLYDGDGPTTPSFSSFSGTTDNTGAYVISAVRSCDYRIRFSKPGSVYALEWFNNQTRKANAQLIAVTDNQTTTVNAELEVGGSIMGRVIAADTGQAINGVGSRGVGQVLDESGGFAGNTTLDTQGYFTITQLPTGRYIVKGYDTKTLDVNYGTLYYPNGRGLSQAQYITVTAPLTVSNINLALPRVGKIVGHIVPTATPQYTEIYALDLANGDTQAVELYRGTIYHGCAPRTLPTIP